MLQLLKKKKSLALPESAPQQHSQQRRQFRAYFSDLACTLNLAPCLSLVVHTLANTPTNQNGSAHKVRRLK
jgi:hypothetical protein